MTQYVFLLFFIATLISSCSSQSQKSSFSFNESEQGVELLEDGQPVFFYQKMPKTLTGEYITNNYLHPLYSLSGDTLTEEFPPDHLHHRGVFWAWHQIYIDDKSVGDGWIMENIEQEVTEVEVTTENLMPKLEVNVNWKSSEYEDRKPFISEKTTITVHPARNEMRKIDFAIALKALVPDVKIGGSDDVKGYGGFCARLKLPEDLAFVSSEGPVTPKTEQVVAGPWMDFSSSYFSEERKMSGVTILCHPETPNYPAPWILRAKTSMQNVVFPGREPVTVPMDEPLVLYYRLIVHNGNASTMNMDELQAEYNNTTVVKPL